MVNGQWSMVIGAGLVFCGKCAVLKDFLFPRPKQNCWKSLKSTVPRDLQLLFFDVTTLACIATKLLACCLLALLCYCTVVRRLLTGACTVEYVLEKLFIQYADGVLKKTKNTVVASLQK